LLTQVRVDSAPALAATACVVYSLGLGVVFTLATDVIVGSVSESRAGSAAAMSETGSELGGAAGIAILGSVGAFSYRSDIADAFAGSPDLARLGRETLGAAVDASNLLIEPAASNLRQVSREAFVASMHVVAATTAVILLFTAVAFAAVMHKASVAHRQGRTVVQAGSDRETSE
jgi:MFS transporter, DHA2 family, multidrug resistance protein